METRKSLEILIKLNASDMLIFNQTGAVGLKYIKNQMSAPVITYQSENITKSIKYANKIKLPVIKHNIADSINSDLKIGDEIPESMYHPVAQIYARVLAKI